MSKGFDMDHENMTEDDFNWLLEQWIIKNGRVPACCFGNFKMLYQIKRFLNWAADHKSGSLYQSCVGDIRLELDINAKEIRFE